MAYLPHMRLPVEMSFLMSGQIARLSESLVAIGVGAHVWLLTSVGS